MSSHGNHSTGAVGPAGYGSEVSKATPLSRLENALSRLDGISSATVATAVSLTGGWPQQQQQQQQQANSASGKDAPANAGVFGAIEDIAGSIHRICDRLDEANIAVVSRLP